MLSQTSVSALAQSIALAPRRKKTIIIGAGEIGKSLKEVLKEVYDVTLRDKDDKVEGQFDVMNIAFPYSDKFVLIVKQYIEQYKPKLVIVHSTVKPGTTRQLGKIAVHSPVNGRHPDLAASIKLFTKFVGGTDPVSTFAAVIFLNAANIKTQVFSSPESTEWAKVLCTRRYGLSIVEMKQTATICEDNNIPFHEVYTEWNNNYNESYAKIGEVRFLRPNLFPLPGEIGGHCVIPNLIFVDDELSDLIKGRNESYKKISELSVAGTDLPTTENSSRKKKRGEKNVHRKRNKGLARRLV